LGEVLAGLSPKGSVNKPAGIRSLFYGMGKGKVGIEGLSVSIRPSKYLSVEIP
jgi:hypothetical protein